jgi:RHS repeat-associated protein
LLGETCSKNCVADPINPGTGNVYTTEDDARFAGSGTIVFQRFYNSADLNGSDGVPGWRHSYGRSITTLYQPASVTYPGQGTLVSPQYQTPALACTSGFAALQGAVPGWSSATATYTGGACVLTAGSTTVGTLAIFLSSPSPPPPPTPIEYDVIRDDGQTIRYTLQNGTVNNPPGTSIRLAVTGSGFTVTDDDDNVEIYNSAGALQSITSRAGLVQTISYDSNGRFQKAVDSFGNSVTVVRNAAFNIGSIALSGGGTVQYTYTGSELTGVTNLDGTTKTYVYGVADYPSALTSIVDESGTTYSSWSYDGQERGYSTQEAGGANAQTLYYNPSNGSVRATDALGAVRIFTYTRVGDINKVTAISGSKCPTCQEMAATTYDSAGWVLSRTDYDGNLTCYANDPVRGLELVRVEGFAAGSTCPASLSSYTPQSGTLQRKITTAWNSTWREPTSIAEPNRTTSFTYDGYGNVLTKTITDTSVSPNVSRTWTYKYFNSGLYGHVQTATGPRTDITTDVTNYTYYSCTTGGGCGHVDTVTNGLNQVTTFNSYNAYGQPLTITDPNSVVTMFTYDARERPTSIEVGTETTSYSYWPIGLVKLVTQPDSSTVQFTYDPAHRLTKITDGLGNYITYTLDALGNHTADSAYDPTGTLHRTHTRVFNALSELYQDVNAAGGSAVTTTYGYDANANQTSINAPLGRNTTPAYDALNRLNQITDPNSGITKLAYDANDNLATVIDPRTLTTSYTHDGFNEMTKLVSPDTGTTNKTYDSAGNLKTSTDARSDVATYSYDALNRVTQVAYSDETINYTYDAGTNGKGRLTGAADANHSMSWSYDTLGRVNGKGQTVGGLTKSVGYSFTNGDMVSLVTPSGQTVTYAYTNHQITSISVNGTAVLSGATYDPFGPVSGWTWGNNTTVTRGYDEDSNPHQIVTAGVTNAYAVDYASRITGLSDSGLSSNSFTYGYDSLDRVTSGTSSAKSRGYTYDANGNRLTQTGSTAYTETNSTTSNQVVSLAGGGIPRTYAYDAAGNTKSYGNNSYTYNARGRMLTATVSGSTTTYIYNALGQLAEKSNSTGATYLVYDEAGHLIGEYSSGGSLIQETIWMGDLPVATLRPNGSTVAIYYVHTDHLGSARKVTRPSDNGLMWRWDPDTFGGNTSSPNQNPSGLGSFVYNLRFPGQYYQAESGLFYNYFRDYDPQTGRYVESDPIGLKGGSFSTYSYVNSNPISFTDPYGLTLRSNWNYFWDWALGAGASNRSYGPNDVETQEMQQSVAAQQMRDAFQKAGCKGVKGLNYGTFQAYWDTTANPFTADWGSTAFEVGGFGGGSVVNNGDGTATYSFPNTSGTHSFWLHAVPDRTSPTGPMRNINQKFSWTEPVPSNCGCSSK